MSSFGERFKCIRVSKELTQEELADDFNKLYGYALTKATISHYETNRRIPEMNTIRKFADYFSVSYTIQYPADMFRKPLIPLAFETQK